MPYPLRNVLEQRRNCVPVEVRRQCVLRVAKRLLNAEEISTVRQHNSDAAVCLSA
jgi:hypothetical protein